MNGLPWPVVAPVTRRANAGVWRGGGKIHLVDQLILCNMDQYPMNIMNNALTIVTGAKFYPSRVSCRCIFSERLI